MTNITSEIVRDIALSAGADLCGIGSMDRFEGAPPQMDPRHLFPEAKACIALGFRIPRGVQRGIEQGTQFYQYPSMAYGGINEIFAPAVMYHIGKSIEDAGYEAFIYRNTGARGAVSDMDGQQGNTLSPEEQINDTNHDKTRTPHRRTVQYTRAVREDMVEPDVQFSFRLAAVASGLGEIGWSKMLLTPEFGPLQRLAFIFTDAPLEPDPMYNGEPLCKRCMACVHECPGNCIPMPDDEGKTITIHIGGKECQWADTDMWRCYAFYTHAGRYYNPFVPKETWDENRNGSLDLMEDVTDLADENEVRKIYSALEEFFPTWVGYNMAKCGGCIRACVSRLERKGGCMEGRFKQRLRTGKAWRLDR